MRARSRWILLGVAVLAVASVVAYSIFAPEGSTHVLQAMPEDAQPAPVRQGSFQGSDGFHHASGTVKLLARPDGGHVLRFEGYDARDGPDVYLYLTRDAGASTADLVEGQGIRLHVEGGAGDGRATLRGDFNVEVPAGTDVSQYGGVTIWCERFDHFFGHAPLA